MRTNEQLTKQMKSHAKAMGIIFVVFLGAIGFGVVFKSIDTILMGIILLQLMISLNNSRRQNEIVLEIRKLQLKKITKSEV